MRPVNSDDVSVLYVCVGSTASTQYDAPMTCAYGEDWLGPHPLCAAAVERDCAEFEAAVARGDYDEQGYTPNERKALAKRKGESWP